MVKSDFIVSFALDPGYADAFKAALLHTVPLGGTVSLIFDTCNP